MKVWWFIIVNMLVIGEKIIFRYRNKKKNLYWVNWMIWLIFCYKVDNVVILGYLIDYSVYLIFRIILGF